MLHILHFNFLFIFAPNRVQNIYCLSPNGREPKCFWGRVFNFKSGCFAKKRQTNGIETHAHLELITQPIFCHFVKTFLKAGFNFQKRKMPSHCLTLVFHQLVAKLKHGSSCIMDHLHWRNFAGDYALSLHV
jgi:hypothetical protein